MHILKFCQDHGIFLILSSLPGVANLSADALSSCQESKEWFINTQVVNSIFRKMGRAQVNLFASRESAHLPVYFSIDRKDRRAAGINALVQRWKFRKKYGFPPPQLIPLILAKVRDFGGSQLLILITPFWTRSAWLPELLQLSIQPPLLFPDRPDTVMDLNRGNAPTVAQQAQVDTMVVMQRILR